MRAYASAAKRSIIVFIEHCGYEIRRILLKSTYTTSSKKKSEQRAAQTKNVKTNERRKNKCLVCKYDKRNNINSETVLKPFGCFLLIESIERTDDNKQKTNKENNDICRRNSSKCGRFFFVPVSEQCQIGNDIRTCKKISRHVKILNFQSFT